MGKHIFPANIEEVAPTIKYKIWITGKPIASCSAFFQGCTQACKNSWSILEESSINFIYEFMAYYSEQILQKRINDKMNIEIIIHIVCYAKAYWLHKLQHLFINMK